MEKPGIVETKYQPPATAGVSDCVIVGAGPAGSSVAIRLAKAGLKVVLIEKARFPREKLCGEFISPECFSHFDELGVAAGIAAGNGAEIRKTVFYGRNGKGVAVDSEWLGSTATNALGLSRAEMDDRLLRQAGAVGVEILEETSATGLLFNDDRVMGVRIKDKNGAEAAAEARITIDASGRGKALGRHLLKTRTSGKAAEFVAFKTHLSGAEVPDDTCEIYSYRGGYGGCNRVEGGYHNLCFIASARDVRRSGSDAGRVLRELVLTNRRAAKVLAAATAEKPWHAVAIERFGRGELVPVSGLLSIGDAAAFNDPFTGSGILMALESGKIAATAILENLSSFNAAAAAYRASYAETFDRRLRISSMLRYAAFLPFAAELTVSTLALSSGLRRCIARATRVRKEELPVFDTKRGQ